MKQCSGASRVSFGVDPAARVCSFCNGTGRCHRCNGERNFVIHTRWPWSRRVVPCGNCRGSGECQLCHDRDHQRVDQEPAFGSGSL